MPYVIVVYAANEEERDTILQRYLPGQADSRAVGVYEMPSRRDESCSGHCDRQKVKKLNGWGRHPQKGFTVHQCGLPHVDRRSRIRTMFLDILGINLLPRVDTPALFQNPGGWGT